MVFGCWTSVSRKSVLPVFESLKGLLFYPVQYEGEEMSPQIFYTGATPNQQLIPAAEFMMSQDGGSKKKFYLLGTDYVFPRTANKILKAFLLSVGVPEARHRRRVHAVRSCRLSDDRREDQGVRKERRRGRAFDDQRRQQRAVLQGVRQPGSDGRRRFRSWRSRLPKTNCARWRPSTWSGTWPRGTTISRIDTPENKAFVEAFKKYAETKGLPGGRRPRHRRSDRSGLLRRLRLEGGGRKGAVVRRRQGQCRPFSAWSSTRRAERRRCTRRIITRIKPVYIGKIRGRRTVRHRSRKSNGLVEPEAFSHYLKAASNAS